MTTDDTARLIAAQASRIEALRKAATDKPPHLRYLEGLLAAVTREERVRVDTPRGCSARAADALYTDVAWCRAAPPERGQVSPFPGEYAAFRLDQNRKAAARREAAARRTSFPALRESLGLG